MAQTNNPNNFFQKHKAFYNMDYCPSLQDNSKNFNRLTLQNPDIRNYAQ